MSQPEHRFTLAALGEILEQQIMLRATVMQQQETIAELGAADPGQAEPVPPEPGPVPPGTP